MAAHQRGQTVTAPIEWSHFLAIGCWRARGASGGPNFDCYTVFGDLIDGDLTSLRRAWDIHGTSVKLAHPRLKPTWAEGVLFRGAPRGPGLCIEHPRRRPTVAPTRESA